MRFSESYGRYLKLQESQEKRQKNYVSLFLVLKMKLTGVEVLQKHLRMRLSINLKMAVSLILLRQVKILVVSVLLVDLWKRLS